MNGGSWRRRTCDENRYGRGGQQLSGRGESWKVLLISTCAHSRGEAGLSSAQRRWHEENHGQSERRSERSGRKISR